MTRVVVVGDALLDRDLDGRAERLCPDAPAPVVDGVVASERPGGAGLAAALLARDGLRTTLVTALGDDPAGATLADLLARRGVEVVDLGLGGSTPEKTRVRADGHPLARIDTGGAPPAVLPPTAAAMRAFGDADVVLVSDYGRGVTAAAGVRAALADAPAPRVWDPHPKGSAPVDGSALITPNRDEARRMARGGDGPEAWARDLAEATGARAVAVTLGAEGALLVNGAGPVLRIPAAPAGGDPCGAGDRLASAAAAALADGCDAAEAVARGVAAATAFVAAGGAAAALRPGAPALDHLRPQAGEVASRTRAAGGRVVATGGCFDLLHAGHVAMLEAARALGDCLVVLMNSDDSVRRLKGPDRPLVHEDDRAAVLRALRCVDAVEVFDEDTPERALADLAPDVFAKGADYAPDDLPEAALVRRLGGEVVTLPYIAGRSTTRLIEEVALRATR